jgi:hypothetical protein
VVAAPTAAPTFEAAARAWLARYSTRFAVRPGTVRYREDFIAAKRAPGGALRGKALADSTLKVNLPTLRMLLDSFVRRG